MIAHTGTSPVVVIDTNLVLSALVFGGGAPATLRRAWPLVSKVTAAELIRVLAYLKFHLGVEEREQLLADYLPYCSSVRVQKGLTGIPSCRDPFDQHFLELALAGRAHYLVSGDKDLLTLSARPSFRIVTAADFIAELPRDEPVTDQGS